MAGNLNSGADYTPDSPVWDEFHTYAIEWEEGEIRWFVDDTHYATQTQDGWFTYYWDDETGYQLGAADAPFNQPFHLLLNLAVGGNWPGAPDASTRFPQTMEIDYVRVYECSAGPGRGAGCGTSDPSAEQVSGHAAPTTESFGLYHQGPLSFTFNTPDGEVVNTLVPGFYDNGTGNVVSNPAAISDSGDTLWQITFNGPAMPSCPVPI